MGVGWGRNRLTSSQLEQKTISMKNVTRLSSSLSTGWSQMNDLETKRPDIKCPNLVPTINDGWDRGLASWTTKERRRDIKHIPNQEIYDVDIHK